MKIKLQNCFPVFLLVIVIASCTPSNSNQEPYWPTDSWRESAPAEQGMDEVLLQEMFEEIDQQGLNIDGVVVVRNGYIVAEKYYRIYEQDTHHEAYSVTKSIVSALVGIAIQEGLISSVDDPVLDYFPERNFENDNELKRSITIENLLTETAGLEWDGGEMMAAPDWVQYVLDQPVYAEPGVEFFYGDGNAHVLSATIQETSGLNAHDFAQKYLFDPLGMDEVRWHEDPLDISTGGTGIRMKPRDIAKFGYLYLRLGMWDGRQIIPVDWIESSTQRYIQVPDPLEPWDLHMGYLWYLHEGGLYAAHGWRGQFIYVIPEHDLVVVITSNIPDEEFVQPQLLIRDYIIPAVESSEN